MPYKEAQTSDERMRAIATFDTGKSLFFDHRDPAMVEWFVQMVEQRLHEREEEPVRHPEGNPKAVIGEDQAQEPKPTSRGLTLAERIPMRNKRQTICPKERMA